MRVQWCWLSQVDAVDGFSEPAASDAVVSAVCRAGIQNAKTVLLLLLPSNNNNAAWLATVATAVANEEDVSSLVPANKHKQVSSMP